MVDAGLLVQSLMGPRLGRRFVLLICAAVIIVFLLLRLEVDWGVRQLAWFRRYKPISTYPPGNLKPLGDDYTRTLVVSRTSLEDTEWIERFLGDDPLLTRAVYTVDDSDADLTVPRNKGHEAMVYLTYIIDHYNDLSDVTMFMHSHQITWHNNDLLDWNAVDMVRRLSSEKVTRDGYVNMRCQLDPGCPDHIHPTTNSDDELQIPEAAVMGKAWLELFPKTTSPPKVLSQPCCAQFAVSKERILSHPYTRYVFFRNWLVQTPLEDQLSGRVWEYVWQSIFAGVDEFCPVESVCYCDGYGICFGSEQNYQHWFALRSKKYDLEKKLNETKTDVEGTQLKSKIGKIALEMQNRKNEAVERGKNPMERAVAAGRAWETGDGF